MKLDEVRERFLKFFEERGHTRHPSDSLVPTNDPSLLFTGAGMNQFKDMFMGRGNLPFNRATTSQKCLRTGDLENVGRTAGHQTFFEMLGNFSFGDYFKKDAIPWHWELFTKVLKISADRLMVSVYEEDSEAADIWINTVGLPESKILKLDAKENFWPANAPADGPNGPCGPCSEIHYDFGEQYSCGAPDCGVTCDCSRWVEIGNLVFTQFDRQDGGKLDPLPQKNIDTGTGLERLAAVLQGVHSNFDTDIFKVILGKEREVIRVEKETPESTTRLRRIADHIRALTFCIADGALPSNEGRGYVVRRILRTALRDGVKLGHDEPFLHKLVSSVVKVMKPQYPDLKDRRKTVENIVKSEEEAFLNTLHRGTALLEEEIARLKKKGESTISGEFAFNLYDRDGFPVELTESVALEKGIRVDRRTFEQLMDEKGEGTDSGTQDAIVKKGALEDLKKEKEPVTKFTGYQVAVADMAKPQSAKVRKIITLPKDALKKYAKSKKDLPAVSTLVNSGKSVKDAGKGTDVAVLLDKTNFYGESGGQIGDTGTLAFDGGRVDVGDTKKPDDYFFHLGKVVEGTLKVGAKVQARIDADRRLNIMRNHTGTHILQAGLKAVLGDTVQQAGSIVEPDRLRFDFTHFQAMTRDEIRKVEDWCNDLIFRDVPVSKKEMSKSEAEAEGAIAFFGEKYGDRVRIVTVGEKDSIEFCGGTHLEQSGTISQLKIVKESSVQTGVRRIEGMTGPAAIRHARERYDVVEDLAKELGCPIPDIGKKLGLMQKTVQELRQEVARLRKTGGGAAELDELISKGGREINGEKIVVGRFDDRKPDDLRGLLDNLIKQKNLGAALLASAVGAKPVLLIAVRKDLIAKGVKAGDLAREIGKRSGGGGGGAPHMAQAGASDASKIDGAFDSFEELVRAALK